jgi:hypothetical protein
MRTLFTLVAATAGFLAVVTTNSSEGHAAGCYYRLYQDGHGIVTGKLGIQGYGHALKTSTACKRARQECNRRFERARKKGNLPRGGPRDFRCIKTTSG